MDSKDGSPYIHNFDLVPPSPPSRSQGQQLELELGSPFIVNNHHQYDPHSEGALTSPPFYDPSGIIQNNLDIDIEGDNSNPNSHLGSGHNSPQFLPHGSPHLQQFHSQHTSHNPSYTNSYLNSPFSQHSELSFTGEDLNFELLSDMVGGIGGPGANPRRRFNDGEETGTGANNDGDYDGYDPSDYDGPSSSSVPATSPPPMGLMGTGMGMGGEVTSSSLLMYTQDADYVSPHFSTDRQEQGQGHSLTQQHLQQHTFNQGSSSSNGDAGDNNNSFTGTADRTRSRHSRASSVASMNRNNYNHQQQQFGSPQPSPSPQPSFQQPLPGPNQPQPHPSPRTFDVARSLGNMSVHTPNWGTQPLPALSLSQTHSPNLRHTTNQPLPPIQQNMKPQSPPRLRMPEDMNFNGDNGEQQGVDDTLSNSLLMAGVVPKINAPDEEMNEGRERNNESGNEVTGNGVGSGNDGGLGAGPRFHIVPATPISGGGVDGGGGVPFQQTLATLTQGAELGFGLQQRHSSPSVPPSTSVSPSTSPAPSPEPERDTFQHAQIQQQHQHQQQSQQQAATHSRNASASPYSAPVQLPGSAPNSAGLPNANNNATRPGTSTINGFVFPDVPSQSLGSTGSTSSGALGSGGLGAFGGSLGVSNAQEQNQGLGGRARSNSDTWGPYEYQHQHQHQHQHQQVLVQRLQAQQALQRQQAAQAQAQAQQQMQAQQMQAFSFGGNNSNNAGTDVDNFLSAENDAGVLRRSISISDTLGAPSRGHRVSRSEDVRLPVLGAGFSQQHQQQGSPYMQNQQLPQGGSGYQPHHGQSNSMGGGLYLDYQQQQQQQQQQQFLHPLGGGVGNAGGNRITRSLSPGGEFRVGHFRRASSGSRSDRGAEVWGSQGSGIGLGVGHSHAHTGSVGSSLGLQRRASPYPSPNASPRVRYEDLQDDDQGAGFGAGLGIGNVGQGGLGIGGGMGMGGMGGSSGVGLGMSIGISSSGMSGGLPEIGEPPVSAGYSDDVPITGRGTYAASSGGRSHAESSASIEGNTGPSPIGGGSVAKQNVTTGRTANASIRRRKQDANFACTVPGCNSTFTRGFNLKGHLRSHYEQKPYKCHWPGCGKGFARQHDCKRHEQLHSNYRPFECEGCRKQFARMDALNRHLRSEAGAECARVVEKSKENGGGGHIAKGDIGMEFDDPAGSGSGSGEDDEKPLQQQVVTTRSGRQVVRRRTNGMEDDWAGVAL